HRLNVIRIHVPPLRQRREDIPALARAFLKNAAAELKAESKVLLPESEQYLQALPWPGNVRQLENTCRWLTVMAPGRKIRLEDLPPELQGEPSQKDADWRDALREYIALRLAVGEHNILDAAARDFERILLTAALQHTGGRKQEAARRLGWGRNTITRKLKELGL
ncbi:MAG TPA: helix-turn-helix domain-containing protein, partial [Acidiferrobacteraceae bacterium]|nr:helix-turn-helix domain-containing protein [Acidiferrobacteraceae bacterium]